MVADELITKGSLPVFPTPGNHDTYPQDQWRNFNKRDNPTVNEFSSLWDVYITDEEEFNTFLDWGYYAKPLMRPDGTKAATILAVNSNVCYMTNFDALIHFSDPGN